MRSHAGRYQVLNLIKAPPGFTDSLLQRGE